MEREKRPKAEGAGGREAAGGGKGMEREKRPKAEGAGGREAAGGGMRRGDRRESIMNYRLTRKTEEIAAYLEGAKVIAFDFETAPTEAWRGERLAALDAHKAEIVGISLSAAPGTGIYIPLGHRKGGKTEIREAISPGCRDGAKADRRNANPAEVIPLLRDLVWENEGVIKAAHNLAFEAMFLYAHGILLREPVYDTIAAAQLTLKAPGEFRKLQDCGLKKLAMELFGTKLPTFTEVVSGKRETKQDPAGRREETRHFDELNPEEAETIRYACADSDFTLRLYHLCNDWFDRNLPRHRWLTEHVESPTAVYCGIMKYNGVGVDREEMIRKRLQCESRIRELKQEIQQILGTGEIGSSCTTKAFRDALYRKMALPVLRRTESGQPATDDQAIQTLKEWCRQNRKELAPLFEKVQEYRKTGKLLTTYLEGYMKHISPATGRIHPEMLPLGTDTGRFACQKPNLQNCPRKTNDPVGIRACLKAPEGWRLLSCDFSQIELRIGSFYCRDARMMEVYRTGGDIHGQTTAIIYGIPYSEAIDKEAPDYKERRTVAKGVNFGLFYGLFPKGLQEQLTFRAGLHPTLEECERMLKRIRAGYPGLGRWQEETKRMAARRGWTETWLGRRRYLPGIYSRDWGRKSFAERCALNTPIQGTAADILKIAMGRILRGLEERPWLRPVLQIHDELVFEVREEHLEEGAAFVKACMEEKPFAELDVALEAEAEWGKDFGNMSTKNP